MKIGWRDTAAVLVPVVGMMVMVHYPAKHGQLVAAWPVLDLIIWGAASLVVASLAARGVLR